MRKWLIPAGFVIGIGLLIRHQIKLGLTHCHWLDRQLQLSRCIQTISLDAEALGVLRIRSFFPKNSSTLALSPDGRYIAVATRTLQFNQNNRDVWGITIPLINSQNNSVTRTLAVDETILDRGNLNSNMRVYGLAFAPEGDLFAASFGIEAVQATYIWNVQSGDRILRVTGDYCPQLKFSQDRRFVLCPERKLRIEDAAVVNLTEKDRLFLDQYWLNGQSLGTGEGTAISPNRDIKASIKDLNALTISRLQEDVSQKTISLDTGTSWGSSSQLNFSPDGHKLLVFLFGGEEMYLWKRGSQDLQRIPTGDIGLAEVEWFPNSDRIAVYFIDGTLKIFELD